MDKIPNNAYRLVDYVGKSNIYIQNSIHNTILVNYESLINNLDLLKHIINIKDIQQINCMDYKSALIIEKELLYNCIPVALEDDFKNKKRSYIDFESFKRHPLYLPLSYVMWTPHIENNINVYSFCNKHTRNMYSLNGNTKLNKETLLRVKEVISNLKIPKTDILKCYLISHYMQSNIEYSNNKKHNLVESILFNNIGTDIAIANTTTLLLNNPIMDVNIRSIHGHRHTWNIIKTDDELYYIDNTYSITKKINSKDFFDQYLFFDNETADAMGYYVKDYTNGMIETEDYKYYEKKRARKKIKKYIKKNY